MRARRSARVTAHTRVGVDSTKAYLYCVYALLGGAIVIRDLYNNCLCDFKSLCERLNESHAVFHRPVVCAVKTELYIGFKLKYCTHVIYDQWHILCSDDFECHSVKRPPRYNSQTDLALRYGVPFVSKLKMMLVFTIHAGIYATCWYLHFMLVP